MHVSGTNVQNIRDTFFHMLYSLLYRSEIHSDGFVVMKMYDDTFTTLVLAAMLLYHFGSIAAMLPDIDSEMEQRQTECVPLERSLSVHCLCNDVIAVKFLVVVICPVLVSTLILELIK